MVNLMRTVLYTLAFATAALSLPMPHKPAVGEIVDFGGGVEYHPHVTLGHDKDGNAILAPVVHHHEVGDRPSMSSKGMEHLHGGRILLKPIIAPASLIDAAPRTKQQKIKGQKKMVSANDVARIQKTMIHHWSKTSGQKR